VYDTDRKTQEDAWYTLRGAAHSSKVAYMTASYLEQELFLVVPRLEYVLFGLCIEAWIVLLKELKVHLHQQLHTQNLPQQTYITKTVQQHRVEYV
jgi:hypothetical protein